MPTTAAKPEIRTLDVMQPPNTPTHEWYEDYV